jgi:predicted alpha/beta superfamily hydrolase
VRDGHSRSQRSLTESSSAPSAAPDQQAAGHTLTGDIRYHEKFRSQFLPTKHDLIVYLPPGYDADKTARYPVLYMQDGQNLFDDATAFSQEWRMDETAQALITEGAIEPPIIVAIYNAGSHRIDEYTPTRDRKRRAGGKASHYGRMLVEELKPFIDGEYRTLGDAANTGVGGSSLGGLVSLYLGLKYSGIFWRLAVLSPSGWWDDRFIVRRVRSLSYKPPLRIWLSVGTHEGGEALEHTRHMRDAFVAKGWALGQDLEYREVAGARHDEAAWAEQVDPMLRYLFPKRAARG